VLFATYVDEPALDDARSGIEDEAEAQTYEIDAANAQDAGTWHLVSDPTLNETWMYWDSTEALQSAYVSDTTDASSGTTETTTDSDTTTAFAPGGGMVGSGN